MNNGDQTHEERILRKERTEVLVGAFIFVGLLIMAVLIWQFGRFGDQFENRYRVNVIFRDASGVVAGAEVRLGGAKVGYVAETPRLMDDFTGIIVPVDIFEQYPVPAGSDFSIDTSGLMGDRYISIEPPEERTGEFLEKEAFVKGGSGDMIEQVTERAAVLSDKFEVVLEELDSAVGEIRLMVANVTSASEKFDQVVLGEENLGRLSHALEKLTVTTDNLASASAQIEPLLEESRQTVTQARAPFERAEAVIAKLEPAVEGLEPAIAELEPTIVELRETIENANTAINRIQEGEGVTAALISDSELRRDLESFISKLEEFGILGYRKADRESGGGPLKGLFGGGKDKSE